MKKSIFVIIIFVLLTGFLINLPTQAPARRQTIPEEIRYVQLAGRSVKVDLAISPEAHARGLSGRASLPDGEGLLFVFDRPGKNMFWMQDMQFPIDIIWINEFMKVIHIEANVSPDSYPTSFGPAADAKYVLEVPADWSEQNNLTVGDSVLFAY